MIDASSPCSDDHLRMLLDADEEEVESRIAADHVESCATCQSRLAELAADREEWAEAKRSLALDESDQRIEQEQAEWSWSTPRRLRASQEWTNWLATQMLAPPSHPEMLGRLGRYEIERMIGAGGMGVVFKGFDSELNRPVAIKVLVPHLAGSGAARKRFAREARAAAAVVHEHVVAIHNVESEGEPPFLVMQYVPGASLQGKLDRLGAMSVCQVLRIARQTAAGLAAAHEQGLVHRDVKPSNILLEEGVDRALLTDFGLARASDDASLTRSGYMPGTPHYMSPEQARGERADQRSDLFSLGSVMYAMCTGRPPFRAETSYGVLRRITDAHPRPIQEVNPEIPLWLCGVIDKLHTKSPRDRYESAAEVAELLGQCLAHVQQPDIQPLPESVAQVTRRVGEYSPPRAVPFRLGIELASFWRAILRTRRAAIVTLGVTFFLIFALAIIAQQRWQGLDQDGKLHEEGKLRTALGHNQPTTYETTNNSLQDLVVAEGPAFIAILLPQGLHAYVTEEGREWLVSRKANSDSPAVHVLTSEELKSYFKSTVLGGKVFSDPSKTYLVIVGERRLALERWLGKPRNKIDEMILDRFEKWRSDSGTDGETIDLFNRFIMEQLRDAHAAQSQPVRGSVVDGQGKPIQGATLYTHSPGAEKFTAQATTGDDGRFEFWVAGGASSQRHDENPDSPLRVVCRARGFGVSHQPLLDRSLSQQLKFTLVKDAPVHGRFVDLEGGPVAGAEISLHRVFEVRGGLDTFVAAVGEANANPYALLTHPWDGPLPGEPKSIRTDADGRFTLSGLGEERLVLLDYKGPGIEQNGIYVMTRDTTPIPLRDTTINGITFPPTTYHGATFEHVVMPGRRILGLVRDQDTLKPIVGARVRDAHGRSTVTGEDGRYHLDGHPKADSYQIAVSEAPAPFFLAQATVVDEPGLASIKVDFDLVRGIPVHGKVTDKATGEPVSGDIRYHALFPNPSVERLGGRVHSPCALARLQPDGSFEIPVLPGPGVLTVVAAKEDDYRRAVITHQQVADFFGEGQVYMPNNRFLVTAVGGQGMGAVSAGLANAAVLINPKDEDVALEQHIELESKAVPRQAAGRSPAN